MEEMFISLLIVDLSNLNEIHKKSNRNIWPELLEA